MMRKITESVDKLAKAKELLEPRHDRQHAGPRAFRKLAQEKVWPQYQKQYAEMWDQIVATKV